MAPACTNAPRPRRSSTWCRAVRAFLALPWVTSGARSRACLPRFPVSSLRKRPPPLILATSSPLAGRHARSAEPDITLGHIGAASHWCCVTLALCHIGVVSHHLVSHHVIEIVHRCYIGVADYPVRESPRAVRSP